MTLATAFSSSRETQHTVAESRMAAITGPLGGSPIADACTEAPDHSIASKLQ